MRAVRKLRSLFVVLSVLLFGLSVLYAGEATHRKIRVGYPSHSASMYPVYATKEGRLFEKYGLDAEMIYVQGVTTSVSVSREYARKNRDVVLRFLKAYIEGTKRLLTERELGVRALKKYGGIQDEELLANTYDLFISKYIRKVPNITPKSVENALKLIAESNPKAKDRKPGEFIDASFMEELERTGFIKSLWP